MAATQEAWRHHHASVLPAHAQECVVIYHAELARDGGPDMADAVVLVDQQLSVRPAPAPFSVPGVVPAAVPLDEHDDEAADVPVIDIHAVPPIEDEDADLVDDVQEGAR